MVRAPASAGVIYGSPNPTVMTRKDTGIYTVRHVGVNATFSVSNTFTPSIIQCIPSVVEPWIQGVASSWSKYRWRKLRWIYIPFCPTSTAGSVHMGLQYDNIDATPTTVAQMSALKAYTTGPVWSGYAGSPCLENPYSNVPAGAIVLTVDVDKFEKNWYPFITQAQFTTQAGISLASVNPYSPARLIFATTDGTATSTPCGRLYAQYDIELIEPQASANNL